MAKQKRKRTNPEPDGDVIEKAVWLLENKRLWQEGSVWRCFTNRESTIPYEITPRGCSCYNGTTTRKNKFCKHYYAAFAPATVRLIIAIRSARNFLELEHYGRNLAEEVLAEGEYFIAKARQAYLDRRAELQEQA
jgi:hypothetical protein